MSDTNSAGTILIKEDTCLPANLSIESETFLPGWRVVKSVDRSMLAYNIEGVNWNFFYLAGEIKSHRLGSQPARNSAQGSEVCSGEAGRAEV
jgi:hypothetical protein